MASLNVGWAWMVNIRSSTVPSSSMTATASAMSSVACGPMMWTPRSLAVFGVGDHFDEAVVAVDDAGLGVAGEGKLADLDFVAFLLGLGLGEAGAADLRIGVGAGGDAVAPDGAEGAAGDVGDGDDAAHGADVGELRQAGDDVADGVDAGLGGLLGFVDLDEAAIELDFRLLDADAFGARCAADGDEDFLSFFLDGLAGGGGPGDFDAGGRLLDLLDFAAGVDVDAALFEEACEFLGYFFVFGRHDARQEFNNRDFGSVAAEDRGELDADCAGADDEEGFRYLGDGENFDVGEDAVVGREAKDGFGGGAGGQDDVLGLELAPGAVGGEGEGVEAAFGRAGERGESGDDGDLVFLHQKSEALGVLVDDGGFALEDVVPVELRGGDVVDAELGGVLEVVPDFCVEEQGLGGDAADVEAGAAEDAVFLNECNFEAELSAANGRGVAGGAAADDGDVVNGLSSRVRQRGLRSGAGCDGARVQQLFSLMEGRGGFVGPSVWKE